MIFHWCDNMSPQVSRTLLGIPTDLNSAVVCKVSILPAISNPSNPFFLAYENSSKCTNYNLYHPPLMLYSSLSSRARSKYFSLSLVFTLFAGTVKSTLQQVPFFFLSLCLVYWPGLGDLFAYQNPREFCAS